MNKTQFLETLQSSELLSDELSSIRQKADNAFFDRGLPGSKDEAFRTISLGKLYDNPYLGADVSSCDRDQLDLALEPYQKENLLVFVNGHFAPRYSKLDQLSDRIIVKPLSEAFQTYQIFLKDRFQKWIAAERNPFALLSLARHGQGLFIYVPNDHIEEHKLVVLDVQTTDQAALSKPVAVVSAGKRSQLKLHSKTLQLQSKSIHTLVNFYFHLEESAQVGHVHQTAQSEQVRLESFRASLKKESRYDLTCIYQGSHKVYSDFYASLEGQRAEVSIASLSALKGVEQVHQNVLIAHRSPNCYSRQLIKNLLDDESRSSFEGKIYVEPIAQQTNAYQLNQNTLLSDKAQSFSRPNLEILADDVKASHGSTTGKVDDSLLFYLRSRGLNQKEAQKILLKAFCLEVVDEIKDEAIKDSIAGDLKEYFAS